MHRWVALRGEVMLQILLKDGYSLLGKAGDQVALVTDDGREDISFSIHPASSMSPTQVARIFKIADMTPERYTTLYAEVQKEETVN